MTIPTAYTQAIYAASTYTTVAEIEAKPGERARRYAHVLETNSFYRWVLDDVTARNGTTVLTHTGGAEGRWLVTGSLNAAGAVEHAYAATVELDLTEGVTHIIEQLEGNITVNVVGFATGTTFHLQVQQDAAVARSITFDSDLKFEGTDSVLSATLDSFTAWTFHCFDDSTARCMSKKAQAS